MDAKETLELLEDHPLTKKFRAERKEEILQARKEAADKIERLQKEAEAVLPGLQSKEDRAREAVATHDKARQKLEGDVARAAMARAEERLRIEHETRQAESVLYETSPPEIETAIQHFRDLHELLLRKKPDHDTATVETNVFRMTKEMSFRTNAPSIGHALRYCIDAIAELQKMKLSPVLDADRIESLKKGIPDVNEMRETSGDKPMPSIITNPRLLMKSDDHLEWELGKLNEKFKKLMKR